MKKQIEYATYDAMLGLYVYNHFAKIGAFLHTKSIMLEVISKIYSASPNKESSKVTTGRREFRRHFDLIESDEMMREVGKMVQKLDEGYVSTPFPLLLMTPASYWRESLNIFLSRLQLNCSIVKVRGDKFESEVNIVVVDRVLASAVGVNRAVAAETACKIALTKLIKVQSSLPDHQLYSMIEYYAGRAVPLKNKVSAFDDLFLELPKAQIG